MEWISFVWKWIQFSVCLCCQIGFILQDMILLNYIEFHDIEPNSVLSKLVQFYFFKTPIHYCSNSFHPIQLNTILHNRTLFSNSLLFSFISSNSIEFHFIQYSSIQANLILFHKIELHSFYDKIDSIQFH